MLSDIEIAQQAKLKPISEIAREAGLSEAEYEPYGRYMAKVDVHESRPAKGRLVLVTATSGMPAGSGKTTTSIALAQAIHRRGKKAVLALREPSLGPVFGMKGGATGGGYSQVLPMEPINLHFTGDFHAITSANNLLAALIDNARHQGQVDFKEILWKRVMDVNDRSLRNIITGLGGRANGTPAETGFDITAASELMAVVCLADSEEDLRARLERIVVGIDREDKPVTVADLKVAGSLMALLKEAMKPNLVQTLEGTPALIHGGPFANIAHGCNSVAATRTALAMGDYAVTEAGFGADLGAEKFINIKCRAAGLKPSAAVLVTSTRALKWHGGQDLKALGEVNVENLRKGLPNLTRHIENLKAFGLNVVVAINHFWTDAEEELDVIRAEAARLGVACALSKGFEKGGEGALELADAVMAAADRDAEIHETYGLEDTLVEKITKITSGIYKAGRLEWSKDAKKDLKRLEAMGYDKLPVCIAKTPFSFSADAKLSGAPEGFEVPVQRLILNAGAGFIVVTTGDIMRMPGLPKAPAALNIDVKDGRITGLA